MNKASSKPIERTITNKINTYFGALDVIKKILFGLKILNINYYIWILLWKIYLIKNVEGDNNEGYIDTLDQNIIHNK